MSGDSIERGYQIVPLHTEQELSAALRRLDDASSDGQELWLLGEVYKLAIEIGTSCGQGTVPESANTEEQAEAASRTLTGALRHEPAFADARAALAKFDVARPADELCDAARQVIRRVSEAYREALRDAKRRHGADEVVELIRDTAGNVLPFHKQMSSWDQQFAMIQQVNQLLGLMDHLAQRQAAMSEAVEDAINDAKAANELIETKRMELADLRAQEASRNLSEHFEALAKAERRKGLGLRGLAVVALFGALCVALLPEVSWMPNTVDQDALSWPVLSRHLAITLLLTGGAAYAAKLASSHYAFGQWAKSIQIQLDSFEGFIGVVEDQNARDRMREEFGRRVLGAPPQASDDAGPGVSTGELLQLLSSVRASSSDVRKS